MGREPGERRPERPNPTVDAGGRWVGGPDYKRQTRFDWVPYALLVAFFVGMFVAMMWWIYR